MKRLKENKPRNSRFEERRRLARQLSKESRLVSNDSIEVLAEFKEIDFETLIGAFKREPKGTYII
ncbi:MAG: hypothetical protein JNN04_16530 [Cyclobacteriaceae bacterium]|nr:hypothetical protein [Cyclobacteriaceae bacterium]